MQPLLHSSWGYPGSIPGGRLALRRWEKPWAMAAREQRPWPGGQQPPGLGNRVRDGERQLGDTHGGLRGRHGARRGHRPSEDVGQFLEIRYLGQGEDCRGEDDWHEDQELLRAGRRQLKRGRNGTAHGVGERGRCGLEAAEPSGCGQEGGARP